jgi:hypothetical protein
LAKEVRGRRNHEKYEIRRLMDEPVGLLLGTSATQQAYGAMYQTLVRQATLLAYIDNFRLLAFLCLLCMPAGFLFKKVRARGGATPMH